MFERSSGSFLTLTYESESVYVSVCVCECVCVCVSVSEWKRVSNSGTLPSAGWATIR